MTVTISREKKNLANKKSGIPDKSGRFSSMYYYIPVCFTIPLTMSLETLRRIPLILTHVPQGNRLVISQRRPLRVRPYTSNYSLISSELTWTSQASLPLGRDRHHMTGYRPQGSTDFLASEWPAEVQRLHVEWVAESPLLSIFNTKQKTVIL